MSGKLHIEGPQGAFAVDLPSGGESITIGRGESANVHLKDTKKQISREHLMLRWADGSGDLTVLGKLSCTVQGATLAAGASAHVRAGDMIVLGDFRLTLQPAGDGADEPSSVTLAPEAAETFGDRRLRDFLAPPSSSAHEAPRLTQWARHGGAGAPPVANPAPPAAVPGLDSQTRGKADLLGQFIAPASERPLNDRLSTSESVAWTPAADTPAASAHGPGIGAYSVPVHGAKRTEPDGRANSSGLIGGWIQAASQDPVLPTLPTTEKTEPQLLRRSAASQDLNDPMPVATTPAPFAAEQCLAALAQALGVDATQPHHPEEWQRLGATLRLLVDGLRLLLSDRKALRSELRVPDPTQFSYSDNNPLKTDLALQELVAILMSAPESSKTYLPFDCSVQEAVDDLRSHNLAIIAATRATVIGMIKEFDPQKLRSTLHVADKEQATPGSAPSFLERSRLWKAYANHYESKNANVADWIERVFDRHFVSAYSREAAKLRSQ